METPHGDQSPAELPHTSSTGMGQADEGTSMTEEDVAGD